MRTFHFHSIIFSIAFAVACAGLHPAHAAGASEPSALSGSVGPASDASNAWKALADESPRPMPPAEWKGKRPEKAVLDAWIKTEKERLNKLAGGLHAFYTSFPKDPNAGEAKLKESQALMFLIRLGDDTADARLTALEAAKLKEPGLGAQERFEIRAGQVQRQSATKTPVEREQAARALIKEFPAMGDAYVLLLAAVANEVDEHSHAVAEEVVKSNAPERIKGEAKALLAKLDAVGKPLNIEFTAVDGRKVDLQAMKGKVVLVDFWATWCGPCVGELPKVKAAFSKLHDKGFEIAGFSFDSDKERLEAFLKENEVSWPQYFDGKRWENKFGVQYGIHSIPTMWLVDKKGLLRDLAARDNLQEKVEKLLAEP